MIRLEKINVKPLFDCNKVLPCIDKSFYNANQMHCLPIIDIFPNFDAIRCFGFSDIYKTNITKHKNIDDVISYFIENIDNNVYKIRTANECFNCEYFSEYYCGCLSYKKDQIINVRE